MKTKEFINCADCDKEIEIKRDEHNNIIKENCPYCSGLDNTKVINMSHICELAHELTKREADRLGFLFDVIDNDGNTKYTEEAQPVFDKYYDLITNTLNF